jgi:murein DD-endopeptidase MepM/ murein hydrolase activator NlpD
MGKREHPHEGLDLRTYRKQDKKDVCYVNEATFIPALFKGEVIHIIDDFLGQTIFIKHDFLKTGLGHFYSIYGHLKLSGKICSGKVVDEGMTIGTVAGGRLVPPHLHISTAWISDKLVPKDMNWETIRDTEKVILVDPLPVTGCPYMVTGINERLL